MFRNTCFSYVAQIMKSRRNVFAFARGLHDRLDYMKNLKETENRRNKQAMQKKIAMMLILMMMAELDAHRVLDSHGRLRKNLSYIKII